MLYLLLPKWYSLAIENDDIGVIMKGMIAAICAVFASSVLADVAAHGEDERAKAVAASFVAQFYDVPADDVDVLVLSKGHGKAAVLATTAKHSCEMELAQAPKEADAPNGWLVGSTKCDRGNTSR